MAGNAQQQRHNGSHASIPNQNCGWSTTVWQRPAHALLLPTGPLPCLLPLPAPYHPPTPPRTFSMTFCLFSPLAICSMLTRFFTLFLQAVRLQYKVVKWPAGQRNRCSPTIVHDSHEQVNLARTCGQQRASQVTRCSPHGTLLQPQPQRQPAEAAPRAPQVCHQPHIDICLQQRCCNLLQARIQHLQAGKGAGGQARQGKGAAVRRLRWRGAGSSSPLELCETQPAPHIAPVFSVKNHRQHTPRSKMHPAVQFSGQAEPVAAGTPLRQLLARCSGSPAPARCAAPAPPTPSCRPPALSRAPSGPQRKGAPSACYCWRLLDPALLDCRLCASFCVLRCAKGPGSSPPSAR